MHQREREKLFRINVTYEQLKTQKIQRLYKGFYEGLSFIKYLKIQFSVQQRVDFETLVRWFSSFLIVSHFPKVSKIYQWTIFPSVVSTRKASLLIMSVKIWLYVRVLIENILNRRSVYVINKQPNINYQCNFQNINI